MKIALAGSVGLYDVGESDEFVHGLAYTDEELSFEDCVPAEFTAAEVAVAVENNSLPRARRSDVDVDGGDCAPPSRGHSPSHSSCPSGSCSSVDPEEKRDDDLTSSASNSTRPSAGGGGNTHHSGGGCSTSSKAAHGWTSAPTDKPLSPVLDAEGFDPELDSLDIDTMHSCQLLAPLGEGAFGQLDLVRLSQPDGSTRLAARRTLPHRDDYTRALLAATQAAAGCPFTVRYLGSCPYLADGLELFTEYAEGGSLEQELETAVRQNPQDPASPHLLLPLERIRVIAASALLALAHLHLQGVAHLALECPRHVLLGATGRVLLSGLSRAAQLGARNHMGRILGTTCCTAPELRCAAGRKPPAVAAESDVYSVGALVGTCAFGYGGPVSAVTGWVADGGAAGLGVPEWVPRDLAEFVRELMASDPGARPSVEEALGHPFLQGLREEDVLL